MHELEEGGGNLDPPIPANLSNPPNLSNPWDRTNQHPIFRQPAPLLIRTKEHKFSWGGGSGSWCLKHWWQPALCVWIFTIFGLNCLVQYVCRMLWRHLLGGWLGASGPPPPCAVGQIFSWLKAGLENFVRLLGCNFVILAGFGGWFGS